jgi:hypothetical protein
MWSLLATFSISAILHENQNNNTLHQVPFVIMLGVLMVNVVMLNVALILKSLVSTLSKNVTQHDNQHNNILHQGLSY